MPRKLSVFCAPERYVQGKDATQLLGEEMQKLGLEVIDRPLHALFGPLINI